MSGGPYRSDVGRTVPVASGAATLPIEGAKGRRPAIGRLASVAPLAALLVALGLASYGQAVIGRPLPGWVPDIADIDEHLVRIYFRPQSVLLAFGFFVAAGLLFVLATRRARTADEAVRGPPLGALALLGDALGRVSLVVFAGGLALWSYLIARLWSGSYGEQYPLLFGFALAGLAAPFLRWDLLAGLRVRYTLGWWELPLLAGLTGTFIALNIRDLDSWRYAFIGDEGSFIGVAQLVGHGRTYNLFSQAGAHGYHPVLTSAYQAMVMKVFGFDYFGWKMASLLSVAATIPAFYVLVRLTFGPRTAAFATVFLSASHYLFAYAHTGYNTIFALFPTVSAFALFFIGRRYASSLALFAAGAAAGLGFYTFYSARAAIVVLAFFVLTMGFRWWRPSFAGVVALGFSLVALPIFAVDKMDVINAMIDQSASASGNPLWRQLLDNLPRSLFAFNYNPNQGHYVAGSLMDPASAVLAIVGLSYCLVRFRSEAYRFLIIWFVITLVVTGLFFHEDSVPLTRMQIVLVAMAAFAGVGVDRTLAVLEGTVRFGKMNAAAVGLSFVALVPLVFALNVQRFWVDSPRHSPTSELTVAVRAVLDGPCETHGLTSVILSLGFRDFLDQIFDNYGLPDDGRPTLYHYPEVSADFLSGASCVVLMDINSEPAQQMLTDIRTLQPTRSVQEISDLSHQSRVVVLTAPAAG